MQGVSGRAVAFALEGARRRGIDPNSLLDGLDLTVEEIAASRFRLDWEAFVTIVTRLESRLGGPEGMRAFGRENAAADSMRLFQVVGRALSHPGDLYRMGVRWMGPALFPMISGRIEELPGGLLRETLTIEPGLPDCPALFYVMQGAFAAMPRAYGHDESIVELELRPNQAILTIEPRTSSSGWLGRSIRAIHRRLAFRSMMREIEDQQASIRASYWEIRGARDRIEAQADQLERVNSIGRRLAAHIELDRVADILVSTLIDQLGVSGVELWLLPPTAGTASSNPEGVPPEPAGSQADPATLGGAATPTATVTAPSVSPFVSPFVSPPGSPPVAPATEIVSSPGAATLAAESRFYRRAGLTKGPPTIRYPLSSAGRDVGTLAVWRQPACDSPSSSEPNVGLGLGPGGEAALPTREERSIALLERLLPWISMALDNARIHAELQVHATDLEHRVKERTARLLAANHHLVREIEERKRATDALVESEAQLRAAERLASVGTLAAGIAHEINNPIGSILAAAQFAQVLDRGPQQPDSTSREEIRKALADIEAQAKRCGGIVRSVLQFSRDERTEKWDCRLGDVLVRSIRLYETRASAAGPPGIDLQLPAVDIWVHVNPIQIEQAVVNLISNAVEAGSSRVRVRVEERTSERVAMIRVLDNGPGIPTSDRLRIFEPFYTTRREAGGTGLGLSVVHGIAAEHGGQLKIEAGIDGGAAALLELPTLPPPAIPLEDKPEEKSPPSTDEHPTD